MTATYLPGVVRARYVAGYVVQVYFDDGTVKHVDISQWFRGPVFEPLKSKSYFKKFFLEGTAIAWPNGVDISPEALYAAKDQRRTSRGRKESVTRRLEAPGGARRQR